MKSFLRFLRPMAFLRRKAIYAGVIGGSRKWLILGGAAWILRFMGRIFSAGEPKPKYTQQLAAGERMFVVHEPLSPAAKNKAARQLAKIQRRSAKAARKTKKSVS